MIIKDGYKVVSIEAAIEIYGWDSKIRSHSGGDGTVEYRVGEWTRPMKKRGPLAVFKTKSDAMLFLRRYGNPFSALYRCRYVSSRRKSLWCFGEREGEKQQMELWHAPAGTVLANRVMIVGREVWYE
jgi:hypothetical protein